MKNSGRLTFIGAVLILNLHWNTLTQSNRDTTGRNMTQKPVNLLNQSRCLRRNLLSHDSSVSPSWYAISPHSIIHSSFYPPHLQTLSLPELSSPPLLNTHAHARCPHACALGSCYSLTQLLLSLFHYQQCFQFTISRPAMLSVHYLMTSNVFS